MRQLSRFLSLPLICLIVGASCVDEQRPTSPGHKRLEPYPTVQFREIKYDLEASLREGYVYVVLRAGGDTHVIDLYHEHLSPPVLLIRLYDPSGFRLWTGSFNLGAFEAAQVEHGEVKGWVYTGKPKGDAVTEAVFRDSVSFDVVFPGPQADVPQ